MAELTQIYNQFRDTNECVSRQNPQRHRENMQTPDRKVSASQWVQTQNPLDTNNCTTVPTGIVLKSKVCTVYDYNITYRLWCKKLSFSMSDVSATIVVDSVIHYQKVTTHDKLFIGLIHSHKSEAYAGFIWIISDYVVHASKTAR